MTRDSRAAFRRRTAATERSIDEAGAVKRADFKAKLDAAKVRSDRRRAQFAALPAVDPSSLTPGVTVLTRRRDAGEIIRVNRTTVTLKDSDREWRVAHADVVHVRAS